MKIIFCLGNPGPEYHKTRHNIGFRIGTAIVESLKLSPAGNKHHAIAFSGSYKKEKVMIIFPQTYMNLSGKSFQSVIQYYKVPSNQCLVVYDDIDIAFGRLLMKPRGSAGTHNGMKSIIEEIQGSDFPRLRVGIGPKPINSVLSEFVLSNFSGEEEKTIPSIQEKCVKAIDIWISSTLERAMVCANNEIL